MRDKGQPFVLTLAEVDLVCDALGDALDAEVGVDWHEEDVNVLRDVQERMRHFWNQENGIHD